MLRVEKIQSYLNCCLCSNLLDQPVALPCGETICKSHLNEMLISPDNYPDLDFEDEKILIKCLLCDKQHHDEFLTVKVLEKMIRLKMGNINCRIFSECNEIINELKDEIKYTETIIHDAENFIHGYFGTIRKEVHLHRETLKENIDNYYEDILKDIEKSENDCETVAKNSNEISKKFDESKDMLDQLTEELDSFEINELSYESLKAKALKLKPKFNEINKEIKNDILVNCKFVFNPIHINENELFGHFEIKNFNSSLILKDKHHDLRNLCNFEYHQKWKLLYRGSAFEFTAKGFHEQCDDVAQILTVIEDTEGNIFGGYTDKEFSSKDSYNHDSKAFLFSLKNYLNIKRKIDCAQPENAIFTSASHGPRFGSAPSLSISDRSDKNESYYNLKSCYIDEDYPNLFVKEKDSFLIKEIEIYTKM